MKCCLNVFFFSLLDCFAKDKGPWIIKPVASSRGRGIYLVSNVSDSSVRYSRSPSLMSILLLSPHPMLPQCSKIKQDAGTAHHTQSASVQGHLLAPSCDQFASHLDHISSCLTRWHRFGCLHRHASDFPAACPGLSLSIPVHGKPSTSLLIRTILHRCT